MEVQGHSLKSPKLGHPVDGDDEKYVSGLSTILVASIQEAKDRISQIEYIFCSQLYPNFQSKSKALHRFYSEARTCLEDQWKEKENELLLRIEKMQLENQRVLEENRLLKVEESKAKAPLEQELLAKQREIEELERELRNKGEEIDEGMELQKNLVELVQSKMSLVVEKERMLKENEEKTKGVLARMMKLEKEVEDLRNGLRRKDEQMAKEIQLREALYSNNLELTTEIGNSEKERKKLLDRIDELEEEAAGIQKKLRIITGEVEEGEVLHKQLRQQLDGYEKEKELHLDKVKCLEDKISQLCKVKSPTCESSSVMDSNQKLVKQVESIRSELQAERKKRVGVIDAYKRLKSQYNFLREKVGLTTENMIHQNKLENESDLYKHRSPTTAPGHKLDTSMDGCYTNIVKSEILEDEFRGLESIIPDTFVAACDTNNVKEETSEDDKAVKLSPPSSSTHCSSKLPSSTKFVSVSGTKRPASSWRQTRSHQSRVGPDPHDDFLDTPLENIRANINNASNKEDLPDPVQRDFSMESSDDETQDLNPKSSPQNKQPFVPLPSKSKKSFKYNEPVRKKAERENLRGVECKQCKKFYDAVLPNPEDTDLDGSKRSLRCEHHDGVSRHRYRYAPPMTPEGFWNIGFESEL